MWLIEKLLENIPEVEPEQVLKKEYIDFSNNTLYIELTMKIYFDLSKYSSQKVICEKYWV